MYKCERPHLQAQRKSVSRNKSNKEEVTFEQMKLDKNLPGAWRAGEGRESVHMRM